MPPNQASVSKQWGDSVWYIIDCYLGGSPGDYVEAVDMETIKGRQLSVCKINTKTKSLGKLSSAATK